MPFTLWSNRAFGHKTPFSIKISAIYAMPIEWQPLSGAPAYRQLAGIALFEVLELLQSKTAPEKLLAYSVNCRSGSVFVCNSFMPKVSTVDCVH